MNLSELDGYIWFDGKIVDWKEAQTHVLTYTLHYGLGVFEGVRAYLTPKGTCVFRLHDHTERLFKSAKTIGMKIPFSSEELIDAQRKIVSLNNLKESYIRPMCFYGSEGLGIRFDNLSVHTIVAAWEWPHYMEPEAQEKGISVKVSSFKRQVRNEVANAKINGNYVQSTVALNEAIEQGFEETLLLDSEGFVAEGSGENFFMVKDNKLITPDLDACLDGITRRTIISLAKELEVDFEERKIQLEEALESDEAFFTGTAVEVMPINAIDKKSIADGLRGPITEKLQKAYLDQVRGKRSGNKDWQSPIDS
ncbi:MAG TPA: branched-chain amino acid transaminase [Gammaproteobacteria bacterium]|jgi:branched-chain amino acid aminotransferase|nr:branched-chain amino acid transaminase [Gammaproteobacteria bacterium]HIA42642.1 branched-chain amino acid transaminase [Gammaproteobacteria bacterium]HIB75756.1 branched-chain amino acid transaminase [Gammaproteobacteria bacterium]HIG49172.1 branched-chain amino acid transaminase [Gammaproteobacteria bacterium]HIM21339.1 branched-chain amino acid transaminase [Gammaproteobacteria bacterium]